jgi:hypothetical protein
VQQRRPHVAGGPGDGNGPAGEESAGGFRHVRALPRRRGRNRPDVSGVILGAHVIL